MTKIVDWQKRDALVNWHPYTQEQTAQAPIVISKAKNTSLWDAEGNEYLDGIASWWSNPHGHCNEQMVSAIHKQLQTLEHVLFGGVTHPNAILLSEKLLSILAGGEHDRIFYSDNGSTAIEVALKMTIQYFHNKKEKRTGFIAFEEAFHGDTFGAMAVSGLDLFTTKYAEYMLPVKRIALPTDENIDELVQELDLFLSKEKTIGFVFEPLVQGAAGMRMYKAIHLDRLVAVCQKHKVFTIADEVMTGFGKTGKTFATDYLKNKPDIICMSKALTGGFLPMAATSCREEIYQGFLSDDCSTAFLHGHTFTAFPTGCAAALASLELLKSENCIKDLKRINDKHQAFAEELSTLQIVENIGVLGVILRFELITEGKHRAHEMYGSLRNELYLFFLENGVLLRPLGNVIYILPPYCITNIELDKIYFVIMKAINKFC